jgi:hypothetical protein
MEPGPVLTDKQALDQLAKSGSDLTKVHRVDFFMHFPTQKAAEKAQMQLIALAFETNIEPGKTDGVWAIQASKSMYPVESDLAGLRDKLDVIATAGRGSYDGWKAKVRETPQKK